MPIMIFMTKFYHSPISYYRFISVLFKNLNTIYFSAAVLLCFSLISCEEKPTIFGSDLLPSSDFVDIKSTDTIRVEGYTQYIKSVVTNNLTYSYLGRNYDPYFGDTKVDFVGQLRLIDPWKGGGPFSVDSVSMTFTFQGIKGIIDTDYVYRIKLYEITEQLYPTVKYYSDNDPHAGMEIGTFDLPNFKKDTLSRFSINLPVSFGEYLMRDTTKLNQDEGANDFRAFFKGLYITMVDPPKPFIVAHVFTSSSTTGEIFFPYITVYYHSFKSGTNLSFSFVINSNSVRYNRYQHNFETADPASKIKHINDGVKDSLIFLQAFNGVYPRIKIPGLTYIKNNMSKVSVNKARLTFSVLLDSTYFTPSTRPTQIMMKYTLTDTSQYIVPDYYVNAKFFDGTFNLTSITYSFNLASFVQLYLEGKIPEPVVDMYYPTGEFKNDILKANYSRSPVKFEFTYTRY
jgi:hypothetical protein